MTHIIRKKSQNIVNSMALPLPTLTTSGKQALDQSLNKTVEAQRVPAVFFGATNAKQEIYFECGGDRVFGRPDEGKVTPDTCELR